MSSLRQRGASAIKRASAEIAPADAAFIGLPRPPASLASNPSWQRVLFCCTWRADFTKRQHVLSCSYCLRRVLVDPRSYFILRPIFFLVFAATSDVLGVGGMLSIAGWGGTFFCCSAACAAAKSLALASQKAL